MKVWKFKRRIEIARKIGNFYIQTFHYCSLKNDKRINWTELHCWYECDCEHCPLSREVRGYEDTDCGCYMAEYDEDYPRLLVICMLPNWVKRILLRHRKHIALKELKRLLNEGEGEE